MGEIKGRGGPGRGQGRKRKERPLGVTDKGMAAEVLALPEAADRTKLRPDVKAWHELIWHRDKNGALTPMAADNRRYLTDKRDGKAVHHVNHMHDKPLELNVMHSISEKLRQAMEKAEKRVNQRN